jgi:hypothetical protein
MDRSMKVMFGMMTVAICLMALSMAGNQSQQAYAGEYVGGGDRGTEPTIVWYGIIDEGYGRVAAYRLWNDGRTERRVLGHPSQHDECELTLQGECDWQEIAPPPGGDGVACGADINNDSVVNVYDIMVVLDMWDSNTVCEPTYDCIDLNNLPSGMGG